MIEHSWIFEPHNGYGGKDPDGDPWPFGYISTASHQPIFELSPLLEHPVKDLEKAALLMAEAPNLLRLLRELLKGKRLENATILEALELIGQFSK